MAGLHHIVSGWPKVYSQHINSLRNFSDKWIVGTDAFRTSNIADHATSKQHSTTMAIRTRELAATSSSGPSSCAPIAQALEKLSDGEMQHLRRKFKVAYVVATEKLAFLKYPVICQLEKKHGVDIGHSYLNERLYREIIHYIVEVNGGN